MPMPHIVAQLTGMIRLEFNLKPFQSPQICFQSIVAPMHTEEDSSFNVQSDLFPFFYTSSTTLSMVKNVNTAPQPFPDTLSHANVLHSALERPGEGQESHPMSTSEPHFIEEQPSLPTSLKEFSSLQFTQAYSDQSSDATSMQDIPSHSSNFHSQMTSALSSIMLLITSSQLEWKLTVQEASALIALLNIPMEFPHIISGLF